MNILKLSSVKYLSASFFIIVVTLLTGITQANKTNGLIDTNTLSTIINELHEKQNQELNEYLDSIPDILDCDSMKWMSSCDSINRQSKLNPSAPIRVYNQDGLEFNFKPDTPTHMIRFQLNPTQENARLHMQEMDKMFKNVSIAKGAYEKEMHLIGRSTFMQPIDQVLANHNLSPTLDANKVTISAFISDDCKGCEALVSNLKRFNEKHPGFKISVYAANMNKDHFNELLDEKLPGRVLTNSDLNRVIKISGNNFPYLWLNNKAADIRQVIHSNQTVSMLEKRIERISHAPAKGK